MRVVLAGLALICFASAASAQDPLGPRLGPEITRAERDYFGLFPAVAAAFESAALVQTPAGVDVVVHRAGAPDTTLALDPDAALALRRFAETFEQSPEVRLNPSWQVAAGAGAARRLDPTTPVPYVDPRTQVRARLRGGRGAVGGVVLTATDSLLTLAPAGELYRWDRTPVLRLRPADVEEVEFRPLGLERYRTSALVIGGLVGLAAAAADLVAFDGGFRAVAVFTGSVSAGITIADELYPRPPSPGPYEARVGALRERAAFRLRLPLDYRPADGAPAQFATTPARRLGRVERWRRTYGWVNVSLVTGSASIAPAGSYTDTIVNRRPLTQTTAILTGESTPEASVDIAVRPLPFVRAGVTLTRNRVRVPDGALGVLAVARPAASRFYAELVAPSPRVRGFGVDLALGAGREATTISVTGDTFESNRQTAAFVVEERTVQTFVQASAELVTPRLASYFVRVTTRTLPGLATPAVRLEADDFPGIFAYQLQESSVTFGRVREISFGTRFRF